jgi:hypothetical protein
MSTPRYQSIHGRRPGRGTRPYLLMAKIVLVATLIGGLISLLALILVPSMPVSDEGRRTYADALHRGYTWIIIPSLVGSMAMGLCLLACTGSPLLRMRWLQVKALLIAACVPVLHSVIRNRSQALQSLLATDGADLKAITALHTQILWGTVAALIFAVTTAMLGRIKPRLGQRYGSTAKAEGA